MPQDSNHFGFRACSSVLFFCIAPVKAKVGGGRFQYSPDQTDDKAVRVGNIASFTSWPFATLTTRPECQSLPGRPHRDPSALPSPAPKPRAHCIRVAPPQPKVLVLDPVSGRFVPPCPPSQL